MAQPNVPPRPGQAGKRPGSGKSRPTAKRRPSARPPAKKPGGFSPGPGPAASAVSADPDEVLISPGAPRPSAGKHLKMVPLNGQSEHTYDDGKDLGTSAFARPVPPAAPVPMAAPMSMGPPQMVGIQGPVAGGMMGGPMAGTMPGMAGVPANAYGEMGDPRATSHRVYFVILGFIMMVCASILGSALLVLVAFISTNQEEPLKEIAQNRQALGPQSVPVVDSGIGKAEKPEKVAARPRKPRPKPATGGSSGTEAKSTSPKTAAVAPPPELAGGPGSVSVSLPPGVHASSFEVKCDGVGFRQRQTLNGGKGTMPNVPGAPCNMYLVGAGTKKRFGFTGSANFKCTGVGSDLVCRP